MQAKQANTQMEISLAHFAELDIHNFARDECRGLRPASPRRAAGVAARCRATCRLTRAAARRARRALRTKREAHPAICV